MIGGPQGEAVTFQLFDAESKESKTIELTRRRFITAMGEPIKSRNKAASSPILISRRWTVHHESHRTAFDIWV